MKKMGQCPCCSGKEFDQCCEPIIKAEKTAPTAEALMRARYTAYTLADIDFIRDSMHPRTRKEFQDEPTRQWAEKSKWLGLEIQETRDGGEGDEKGLVEFIARFESDGEEKEHHEMAEFEKADDTWYFVDGKPVGPQTYVRSEPKVGRNDPCPCGSGRKFKKCCGRE